MPTSTLAFETEDIRVGYASARISDGLGAAKFPGTQFQCGFDGALTSHGLIAIDLHDLDTPIPPGSHIAAARFIDGAMDAGTDVRFYVGTGNPWTLSAVHAWNAIPNGTLDQALSAEELDALVDGMTGLTVVPLGAPTRAALTAALGGAGLFWLGMLSDEVSNVTFRWSLEDPWPRLEIDWTPDSGDLSRPCLPPMPHRRRRR